MAVPIPARGEPGGLSWLSGVLLLGASRWRSTSGLGRQINGAYGGAAVLTAIYADSRRTAGGVAVTRSCRWRSGAWNDNLGERDWAHPVRHLPVQLSAWRSVARRGQPPPPATTRAHDRARPARPGLARGRAHRGPDGDRGRRRVPRQRDRHDGRRLGHGAVPRRRRRAPGSAGTGRRQRRDQYQEVPLASDVPGAVAVARGQGRPVPVDDGDRGLLPRPGRVLPGRAQPPPAAAAARRPASGLLASAFPPDLFTQHEDGFLHSLAGALTGAVERAAELRGPTPRVSGRRCWARCR